MKLNSLTLAKRYARAMFELANEQASLEVVSDDLNAIHSIFKTSPDFVKQLISPSLPKEAKQNIVTMLKQDATPLVQNFIQMIFEYQHFDIMVLIVDYFNQLVDEKNKTVHASVTTAVAIDDDQSARLATKLAQHLGADKVILETIVNPHIIGGVVIQADGKIIDGSLTTKIAKIRRMLVK